MINDWFNGRYTKTMYAVVNRFIGKYDELKKTWTSPNKRTTISNSCCLTFDRKSLSP